MKAHNDKGPNYDYYNDPLYAITNEEAERELNDLRTIVASGPPQPTAKEKVLMLEEEIRQLIGTKSKIN